MRVLELKNQVKFHTDLGDPWPDLTRPKLFSRWPLSPVQLCHEACVHTYTLLYDSDDYEETDINSEN